MNIIYMIFYIVINLCMCYDTNGLREVRLTKVSHGMRVVDRKIMFSVLFEEPLQIVFEEFDAKIAECRRATDSGLLFDSTSNILYRNRNTIITIPTVTSEMSTKWNCTLVDDKDSQTVYLFDIRVKQTKKINVTIGEDVLVFSPSEQYQEYEGIKEYSCEEGDTVDLTCSNLYHNGGIRLKYYGVNGTKIAETDKIQTKAPLNFRLLVRTENDGSYVDCTYLSSDHQEFTYRIIFKVTNDAHRNSDFIVTVNDFRLTPKLGKVNGADIYNYKFNYGEYIIVTCELKDKTILSDIVKGIETPSNIIIDTYDINKTQSFYQFRVDTIHLDNSSIECSTSIPVSGFFLKASIKFYVDAYGDPAILGLPAKDLLYEYRENVNESMAHYQCTPNTTLPLTCMTTRETLRWFHQKNMYTGNLTKNLPRGTRSITDTFPLDHGTIACATSQNKKTVIFHQKEDDDKIYRQIGSSSTQILNVIISCAAGVLLAVIAAIGTFYWRKKHTNAANKEKKPYRYFCENVNPIPAVSSQLENNEYTYIKNDYTYIQYDGDASVANSMYYRSRQDNRGRFSNQTENHYAEIDDCYSYKGTTSNNVYQNNNPVSYSNLQNENCNGYYNLQNDTGYKNSTH